MALCSPGVVPSRQNEARYFPSWPPALRCYPQKGELVSYVALQKAEFLSYDVLHRCRQASRLLLGYRVEGFASRIKG